MFTTDEVLACAADRELSDAEVIEGIRVEERRSRIHAARRTALVAELARRRPGDERGLSHEDTAVSFSRWAPDELGIALGLSRMTAKVRLLEAVRLHTLFPDTVRAWQAGVIDEGRARVVAESTLVLLDDAARLVEPLVLPDAADQTVPQLRAAVREAVLRVDPDGANRRHHRARERRLVQVFAEDDGMAALRAELPATTADAVWHTLTGLGRSLRETGDPRTLDQLRADLVGDLLLGRLTLTDHADPTRRRHMPRPTGTFVQVVVGLDTLTGRSDAPARLVGFGPIPADLAREAALDGVWRRLVTDPLDGALLDHGRRTYRPPAALADHVRSRDQHCRGPGCRRRAIGADLDHHHRWSEGGATSDANLVGACRHHHTLKEQPDWDVEVHPDGAITWTTPTGHRHTTRPFDYRPHTASGLSPPDPHPGRPPDPGEVAQGVPHPRAALGGHRTDADPPPF